jgi:hypothetical protein
MTREEFKAVAETVLDDIVMADEQRTDPGWLDTIMRAADAYKNTGGSHHAQFWLTPQAEAELARWDGYARQAGAS